MNLSDLFVTEDDFRADRKCREGLRKILESPQLALAMQVIVNEDRRKVMPMSVQPQVANNARMQTQGVVSFLHALHRLTLEPLAAPTAPTEETHFTDWWGCPIPLDEIPPELRSRKPPAPICPLIEKPEDGPLPATMPRA